MKQDMWRFFLSITLALGLIVLPALADQASPSSDLPPGTWADITPPNADIVDGKDFNGYRFFNTLVVAPGKPSLIYAGQTKHGVWKSSDGGKTWELIHAGAKLSAPTTPRLDNPAFLAIDPKNPAHFYCANPGWSGDFTTLGFWESNDAAQTWHLPQGWQDVCAIGGSRDAGSIAIDPADFRHVLIGIRYTPHEDFGLVETRDGGKTCRIAKLPVPKRGGTLVAFFLYDPVRKVGNPDRWLMQIGDSQSLWLTKDAGATWDNVFPEFHARHGGACLFRSPAGTLLLGGAANEYRSTDNGSTWKKLDCPGYVSMCAYGKKLLGGYNGNPYLSEDDGQHWKQLPGTSGSSAMTYVPSTGIIYSAAWEKGLRAMKVPVADR